MPKKPKKWFRNPFLVLTSTGEAARLARHITTESFIGIPAGGRKPVKKRRK